MCMLWIPLWMIILLTPSSLNRPFSSSEGEQLGKIRHCSQETEKDFKMIYYNVRFEDGVASGGGVKASTQGMRSWKFCLHPTGDTPSSCRLFDAIVKHYVPVIVSDRIEIPFEDEIDYSEFSIFFSVPEVLVPNFMVNTCGKLQERWVEMWEKLNDFSHHY